MQENMERIDLNVVRGFSDCITVTFNFVKQEFKPLIRALAVIVLPLILVDMFLKSYLVGDALKFSLGMEENLDESFSFFALSLWSYLMTMIVYFWMGLFAIAYIKIYNERESDERITTGEVWKVMMRYFGKALGWNILYGMMIGFGIIIFLIPGIYLAIVFIFTLYFMVLSEQPFSQAMSSSSQLVKGNWWNVCGYVLVLGLIVSGLSYVFAIPYGLLTFSSLFSGELPGQYESAFAMMFSTLGSNTLLILSYIGLAVRFFSMREEKEHTALLGKIDEIGNN